MMLEHALWLANTLGPILPLHSLHGGSCTCGGGPESKCKPGKHPRTRNGLKDATRDPAVIGDWFRRWPDANVGLRLDDLVVVDLDPRNGGFETMQRAGWGFPGGHVVSTGSGGLHFYFRPTTPVRSGAHVLGKGVDVLAGPKHYCVAPPSVTARPYAWIDTSPIGPLPEWIAKAAAPVTEPVRAYSAPPIPVLPGEAFDRASRYVESVPGAIEGQGGSIRTYKLTLALVRGFMLSDDEVWTLLLRYNQRCVGPWEEHELAQKIECAHRSTVTPGYLLQRANPPTEWVRQGAIRAGASR